MARVFSAGEIAKNTSFGGANAVGTISTWLKPDFNSGDGLVHRFWSMEGSTNDDCPSFQKFNDNNTYAGFNGNGGGEQRIIISDTGLFSIGVWANWIFTWSNAAGQVLYKNTLSKGTRPLTFPTAATGAAVGNFPGDIGGTGGTLADFAYWDIILSGGEIAALSIGVRPPQIRPASLKVYWPLDGLQSPEPDLSGSALNATLTGTTLAAGPPTTLFTPKPPTQPLSLPTPPPSSATIYAFDQMAARFSRNITTIGY